MTDDFWGPPIHSYSRKQALADGILVDATEMAREAGFKYPVAVGYNVWNDYIVPDEAGRAMGQSIEGRLWDVLFMLSAAVVRGATGPEVHYQVVFLFDGAEHREVTLKALCGPDDDGRPCITILNPDED